MNKQSNDQSTPDRTRWLAMVLFVDAVVTGLNGLVYLIAAPVISEWLGADPMFLRGIGAFLTVYALVIVVIARRRPVPLAGAWFALLMNAAWTVASLLIAAAGALDLTDWGRFWAVAQAVVVAGFAVAQFIGIRRAVARS